MARRANSRRPLAVHVPTELYEWIDAEAERRNVSRSKLIYAAIEFFRLMAGVGQAATVVDRVREDIPAPDRRRVTKLRAYLDRRREEQPRA